MSSLGPFGAERGLTAEVQPGVQAMVLEGSSLPGLGSRAQARGADARVKFGVLTSCCCRICSHTQGRARGVRDQPWQTLKGQEPQGRDACVVGLAGSISLHCGSFSSPENQCGALLGKSPSLGRPHGKKGS